MGRPSQVFYDSFPRFIEFFVKEKRLLSIEEAIRKCTSLPALVMNINGRGSIEKGNFGDIVVLDLPRLGTTATFASPSVPPTGVDHVFVNGTPVVTGGIFNGEALPGRMLRRR